MKFQTSMVAASKVKSEAKFEVVMFSPLPSNLKSFVKKQSADKVH